jgi:hypothetical protein
MNYIVGDTVQLPFELHDGPNASDALADPTTLQCIVRSPVTLTQTTYYWPTGSPAITRTAAGLFYASVTASEAGRWLYQWVSTGKVTVRQGSFTVEARSF